MKLSDLPFKDGEGCISSLWRPLVVSSRLEERWRSSDAFFLPVLDFRPSLHVFHYLMSRSKITTDLTVFLSFLKRDRTCDAIKKDVNTLKAAKLLGFSSFSFSFFSARGEGSSSVRTSAAGSGAASGTTFTSSSVMGVAITSATVATGTPTSGGGSWTSLEELWTGM